jgi:hypothetical protein
MVTLKSRRTGMDLRNHPMVTAPLKLRQQWSERLRAVPDEVIREIVDCKDVGSARAKMAGMLVKMDRSDPALS